jgi:isopentenyldiphosphate isomerase
MPDELLDVVNDSDEVIAQEMRSTVHRLGLQHRGVHIFLVTPRGELLVQRRGRHQEAFPLALDCSVSEHLKAGENYIQAALRGLLEELGVHDADIQPLVKFQMLYGPNDDEICILYEGRINPTLVHFDPSEVEGIAYYTLVELAALIESGGEAFSSWFVQLIWWYVGKPSELDVLEIFQHERLLFPAISK